MKKAPVRVIKKVQTLHAKLESLEDDFRELYVKEVWGPDGFDHFKQQVEFWLMEQSGL
jgi:hypothetical protein